MEVALCSCRLIQKRVVMPPTRPGLIKRVEVIAESEWPVIECETTGRAVVAIEIALAVANTNPVCHKRCEPIAELFCQQQHLFRKLQGLINNIAVFTIN